MFMVESRDGFDYRERSKKAKKREIAVDLGPEPITPEITGAVLSKVFVSGKTEFLSEVPDYWKPCVKAAFHMETHETGFPLYPLRNGCSFGSRMLTALSISSRELGAEIGAEVTPSQNGSDRVTLRPPNSVIKVGGGVSAPKTISAPDPEYSVEAREARFSGTVVFGLIVDQRGMPKEIEVVRPIGFGLDDVGVGTLQNWRFEPAKKDGEPGAVHINVEVQFRIN
jgi:TonB family protein